MMDSPEVRCQNCCIGTSANGISIGGLMSLIDISGERPDGKWIPIAKAGRCIHCGTVGTIEMLPGAYKAGIKEPQLRSIMVPKRLCANFSIAEILSQGIKPVLGQPRPIKRDYNETIEPEEAPIL